MDSRMTMRSFQSQVENPGVPLRQPATALLTVDTADRSIVAKVNNLIINKQATIVQGYFTRVALTEINLNWDIPNVNAYNNTMTVVFFFAPGLFKTVKFTVPESYYTMDQLSNILTSQMNTFIAADPDLAGVYTMLCSVDIEQRKFTLQNTNVSAKTFSIIPAVSNNTQATDLCSLMGFETADTTLNYTQIQGGYATMLYTPYIDVISKQLTKKQNVKDNSTSLNTGENLLARIYINEFGINGNKLNNTDTVGAQKNGQLGSKPFTIHYEFQNPKQIYWDTKEFIGMIDLQLQDNVGRILYEVPESITAVGTPGGQVYKIGSGEANWQITLQITET